MVGFIPKSFQIAQLNRYKPLSWVKYHLIVLSIQMGGVAIMAWLMWVMLNTFGEIIAKMSLLMVSVISTVLNPFGVLPKKGLQNLTV